MAYGDDPAVDVGLPTAVSPVPQAQVSGYGKDHAVTGYGKDPVSNVASPSIYEDEPGRYYGNLLPFSENETTHEKRWGIEENALVRSLARGMRDMGGRLTGPLTPEKLRGLNPDEQAAYLTFGGLPAKFGAGDPRNTLANPNNPMPTMRVTPEKLIGGLTPEQAKIIADSVQTEVKAGEKVSKRLGQDLAADTRTPEDIVAELNRGRQLEKPVALVDVAGANTQGLAGTTSRQPGESKAIYDRFFKSRDDSVGERTQADVSKYLAQGPSARRTVQGLQQLQVQEAAPLYKKAFEGGSIAPLEHQFTEAFNVASKTEKDVGRELAVAQNRLTTARAKSSQAGNVYSDSAANQAVREAQIGVTQAEAGVTAAQAEKQQILDVLRQTQEDASLNRPGAVWNPRIQQFLDDPLSKAGLAKGVELERLAALAEGRRFNPTEYAIVGEENGAPIVSKVPNMRTLDALKKGYDSIIQSERGTDGRLSQRGNEVNKVRKALLKEMDAINPDYAPARASWQGDAASMDAVNFGKNIHKYSPEEVRDFVADRSVSDKDFLRLGVADNILERIARTSYGGDEAKHMIKSEWAKGQLKPVFRSEADFRNFVDSTAMERLMYDTKTLVSGNSATAARAGEDIAHNLAAGASALRGAGHAVAGSVPSALLSVAHTIRYLGLRPKPELNAAIAKILTDTNIDIQVGKNGKLVVSSRVPLLDEKGQILHNKPPPVRRFLFDQVPPEPPGMAKGGSVDADMLRQFEDASAENKVPLSHLLAFGRLESNFDPKAVSPTGARGVMQILPSTAAKPGYGVEGIDPEMLLDAKANIDFGAKYVAALAKQTGLTDWDNPDQLSKVLQRYSGGADTNYNSNFNKHLASYGGIQARSREDALPGENSPITEPSSQNISFNDPPATLEEEQSPEEETVLGMPLYVWNVLDKNYKEKLLRAAVEKGVMPVEQAKKLLNQQSYAEGGLVESSIPSTPEPQVDIDAQTASMENPESTKDSVFIAQGSPYPPDIPVGTIVVRRPEGDLMTPSLDKAGLFLNAQDLTDQIMADILGYAEAKSEVQDPTVVQGVEPTGAVSSEMLSSPDKTADAAKAILAQSPNAALRMLTPDLAQQRRRLGAYIGQV